MPKPSDDRQVLPPEVAVPEAPAGDWWVAYTRTGAEKGLAWDPVRPGVPRLLPVVERTSFAGGRGRVALPVPFPSYVFVCGDGRARLRVLGVAGVVRVPPATPRAEIGATHRATRGGRGRYPPVPGALRPATRGRRGRRRRPEGRAARPAVVGPWGVWVWTPSNGDAVGLVG